MKTSTFINSLFPWLRPSRDHHIDIGAMGRVRVNKPLGPGMEAAIYDTFRQATLPIQGMGSLVARQTDYTVSSAPQISQGLYNPGSLPLNFANLGTNGQLVGLPANPVGGSAQGGFAAIDPSVIVAGLQVRSGDVGSI